jgi:hypothetical protein
VTQVTLRSKLMAGTLSREPNTKINRKKDDVLA